MKKIIIIAAVVISSGLTAYCLSPKQDKTVDANKLKIDKTEFAVKSMNGPKSDLATAD